MLEPNCLLSERVSVHFPIWKTRESATVIHIPASNPWNQGLAVGRCVRAKDEREWFIINILSNIAGGSLVINLRVTAWNVTCIMFLR